MKVLKRQVHSLTMHQKKLETELQQIEEKFESKKRKFVDSSSTFQEDLVRTCRKPIDEEAFQLLIEQQTELIKKEREREKERQAELQREVTNYSIGIKTNFYCAKVPSLAWGF